MKHILLFGDPILDIYVYGSAIGKSLETPTIVAKEQDRKISFGGSSLVARNILELGGKVSYVTVLGNDKEAKLYEGLKHKNLTKHFIVDPIRRTTIKKRFWVDGYKLLQIDNLDNRDISQKIQGEIVQIVNKEMVKTDVVVISDYRHGMMTPHIINFVLKTANQHNKKVFVDSQVSHRKSVHHYYKDSYMVLLSEKEAKDVDPNFGLDNFDELKHKLGKSNICVKLGENGSIASVKGKVVKTSAIKVQPLDVCGAGDAFLAALCISDLDNIEASLKKSNIWAGLSTLIHGTTPPKKADLEKHIKGETE